MQIYNIETKSFIFSKTYNKGYASFGMIAENPVHVGVYGFVGYCQQTVDSIYCYVYSCNDIIQSNNDSINILSSLDWAQVDMGVKLAQGNDRKINTGWCRWGADGTLLCCEIGATTWDSFWRYAPCSYYISEELEPSTHKVYTSGKYAYSYMPTSEPYWYIESGKMAKNIKTNSSFFLVGITSSSSDASTQTAAGGYYPGGIIIQPQYNSSGGSGKTNEILKYTIDFENRSSTKEVIGYYSNFYTIFNKSISGIDGMYYNIDNKFYGYKFTDNLLSMIRLGIKYSNTSDANITTNDVINGKIGYNAEGKVIGTIQDLSNDLAGITSITTDPYLNDYVKVLCPVLAKVDMNSWFRISKNAIAEFGGITPDKIVQGNTIYDVIGTGEGRVKIFTTEDDMNNYTGAKDKDLAMIYRDGMTNWKYSSEAQVVTFPGYVGNYSRISTTKQYYYVDSPETVAFTLAIQQTLAIFEGNLKDGRHLKITWTGTNFSFTSRVIELAGETITDNTIDLGGKIKFMGTETEFNDVEQLAYFITYQENYYGGSYQYDGTKWNSLDSSAPMTQVEYDQALTTANEIKGGN